MKGNLVLAALLAAVLLGGCAQKGSPVPERMPDGHGTRVFSAASEPVQIQYIGQWRDDQPKGEGMVQMVAPQRTMTCQGEFGVERPVGAGTGADANLGAGTVLNYARGDVQLDGRLLFRGSFFSALFFNGQTFQGGHCLLNEGTMYSAYGGQKITGRFFRNNTRLIPGPCEVQRSSGEMLIGNCSATQPDQIANVEYLGQTTHSLIDLPKFLAAENNDYFRLVSGPGAYIDAAGIRYEGEINRSSALNGLYRVVRSGEKSSTKARFANGKLVAEYSSPEVVAAQGRACGNTQWLLMKGDCVNGAWAGAIDAYTADGLTNLRATFAGGVATSEATIVSLEDGRVAHGKLRSPFTGEATFAHGRLTVGDTVEYDGEMQGLKPHGKGVCTFEGAPEVCEYLGGQRIDALYKMREENRRAAAAVAAAQAAAPAANYTATGQPAVPGSAGSTAGAIAAECAKKFVAMKACDRMPGLGANLCRAAANKKFSHLACSVIQ